MSFLQIREGTWGKRGDSDFWISSHICCTQDTAGLYLFCNIRIPWNMISPLSVHCHKRELNLKTSQKFMWLKPTTQMIAENKYIHVFVLSAGSKQDNKTVCLEENDAKTLPSLLLFFAHILSFSILIVQFKWSIIKPCCRIGWQPICRYSDKQNLTRGSH